MKVILTTRDGGFVHESTIPPMTPPPEVIVWGTRVFVYRLEGSIGRASISEPLPLTYVEGVIWTIV